MDSLLNYDPYDLYLRNGKTVNMCEQLNELEMKYRADLKADVESYDLYDEVSNETLCDLNAVKTCLKIFNTLGYIDADELKLMESYAESLRKDTLNKLHFEKFTMGGF